MDRDSIDRALRSFLGEGDGIIFVGSGPSIISGLPNWEALVTALIDEASARGIPCRVAQEALENRHLLDAADALKFSQSEVVSILKQRLGFAAARPHKIHELLIRLGPQRFVTTNFDSLIEQQLGAASRLAAFQVVTGRQVSGLADIVKASADNFVFKPHGDISDPDSIVLATRDYERVIIGDENTTRRALETLLITRPVLFVGYGLRDPDTALVLRTIRDRYLGSIGHFYALIADATSEHREHWWERYRIRVLPYKTHPKGKTGRDHGELVSILERVALKPPSEALVSKRLRSSGLAALLERRLLRYAARLIRPDVASFPILARLKDADAWARSGAPVWGQIELPDLLQQSTISFVLEGPAGSGKSFAIGQFLSSCGMRLLQYAETAEQNGSRRLMPVLLDARLYQGSFEQIFRNSVSSGLAVEEFSGQDDVLIILDSVDEMPAVHLESGRWRADFDLFVRRFRCCRIVFGTRRAELIGRPDLPIFQVQPLSEFFVDNALDEVGISPANVAAEFRSNLQTPFLLKLGQRFLRRDGEIRSAPALLSEFLESGVTRAARSKGRMDLRERLSGLGARLVREGRETISVSEAATLLSIPKAESSFVDQLVSAGIFVSEIDAHIRFVHRTLTEFLASDDIVSKWRDRRSEIAECLTSLRWDNSIIWAAESLSGEEAQSFISDVFQVDPALALRAVGSAELRNDRLWLGLLTCLDRAELTDDQAFDFMNVEVGGRLPSVAAPMLRRMSKRTGWLGGWAASLFLQFASTKQVRASILRINQCIYDYQYAHQYAQELGKRVDLSSLRFALRELENVEAAVAEKENTGEDENIDAQTFWYKFLAGAAEKFEEMMVEWCQFKSPVIRGIVAHALYERPGASIDNLFEEELRAENLDIVFPLYMRLSYLRDWRPSVPNYTPESLRFLVSCAKAEGGGNRWSLSLLRTLTSLDWEWGQACRSAEGFDSDIRRALAALRSGASDKTKQAFVRSALSSLADRDSFALSAVAELAKSPLVLDESIALNAIQKFGIGAVESLREFFRELGRGTVAASVERLDDWVDALAGAARELELHAEIDPWVIHEAGQFIATAFSISGRFRLLERASDPDDAARDFLLGYVICAMSSVTTDDVPSAARLRMVSLFIEECSQRIPNPGSIATEEFVSDIILPMAVERSGTESERGVFEEFLREASQRHGRRYFAPWRLPQISAESL